MSRLVRVGDNTFKELAALAGKLQAKYKKFVSMDDLLYYFACKENKKMKKFSERMKDK